MKKAITIAWKDLLVAFRDPAALLMMLVTPLALTFAIAFAFGDITGKQSGSQGISKIPVIIVNQDTGLFGEVILQSFQSSDLQDLIQPGIEKDEALARRAVDENQCAAAVIIPQGLSDKIIPTGVNQAQLLTQIKPDPAIIEVYSNPTMPVSAGIIRAITSEIANTILVGRASSLVSINMLVKSGVLTPQQAVQQGAEISQQAARSAMDTHLVALNNHTSNKSETDEFDWLKYSSPSMAILFLMFTVTAGGRSLLYERDAGTLPRLLISPTGSGWIIFGKILGVFLTGLAQMLILYGASRLLFNVNWGDPPAVLLVTVVLVAAATSWGILLAAYSRSVGQAGTLGSALTLIFGALAGNFLPRGSLPDWMQTISYISPNAWGLDAFTRLSSGGDIQNILPKVAGLAGMAIVLFIVSLFAFRRQYQ